MPDNQTTSNFVSRFIGFDRMLGSFIIKVAYHLGLIGIVVACGLAIYSILSGNPAYPGPVPEWGPVPNAVAIVPIGVVWIVLWRYVCELSILLFQIYNRLGEIRDRLPEIEHSKKLASHV